MENRQSLILSGAGILCLLPILVTGNILLNYDVLDISTLVLHSGIIYLTLGLFTYLRSPITPYDAVVGTLCAAGLVFMSKAVGMYYGLVLIPPESYSPLTLPYLVGVPLQILFYTLPLSTGYLSGVLIRDNRRKVAIVLILGPMLGGWLGGSWTSLSLGSAPGFT